MQERDYSTADVAEGIYLFISENILTALILLPFVYVILFADLAGFFSELLPATFFQDFTIAVFLGVVIFGIAWVVVNELQKRKASPLLELTRQR